MRPLHGRLTGCNACQGARYRESLTPVRTSLRALDNDHDILIVTYCGWPGQLPSGDEVWYTSMDDADCVHDTRRAHSTNETLDYEALLLRSRFAAVVVGEGAHSYRLYEAMAAGAVPVVREMA